VDAEGDELLPLAQHLDLGLELALQELGGLDLGERATRDAVDQRPLRPLSDPHQRRRP
jgi:hypothetical protein